MSQPHEFAAQLIPLHTSKLCDLMQTACKRDYSESFQRTLGASGDGSSLATASDPCNFPKVPSGNSPFYQAPSSERRLNLSETANELSTCPEEVSLPLPV